MLDIALDQTGIDTPADGESPAVDEVEGVTVLLSKTSTPYRQHPSPNGIDRPKHVYETGVLS